MSLPSIVAAATDVEKWAGWLANIFSTNNPRFVSLLTEIASQLEIDPVGQMGQGHVEEMLPKFRTLKLNADGLVALTAEDMIAHTHAATAAIGKFNDLQEANFGDPTAYFQGLDALVGRPNVNLLDAVKHEHASDQMVISPNYLVSTTPRKEWALVFGDSETRAQIIGGDKLSGGSRTGIALHDREWVDLDKLLSDAHELMNVDREKSHCVTKAEVAAVGLLPEEIGCLRLYTGPMYIHYNTLLRVRGDSAHEYHVTKQALLWACQAAQDAKPLPPLDEQLFCPPLDSVVAKRAIVWSALHSSSSENSSHLAQINGLDFNELLDFDKTAPIDPRLVFPSLVFGVSGDSPTLFDSLAVLWARRMLRNKCDLLEEMHRNPEFDSEEKIIRAQRAISASRRLAKAAELFQNEIWASALGMRAFNLEPNLGSMYTTTIHLISSGMIKLARLQPSIQLFRGFGGRQFRLPKMFTENHEKHNTRGGVEFAFMSCSRSRDVAIEYSRGGYLLQLKTGLTTRGADLSWLSFYPEEKEVCLPPCTAIEVLAKDKVVDDIVVMDLVVVANPAAATIDTFLKQRQNVVIELGDIVLQTVSQTRFLIEMYNTSQKEQHFSWFNNSSQFAGSLQGLLDLARSIQEAKGDAFALVHFAIQAKSPQVLSELARQQYLNPFTPLWFDHNRCLLIDECVKSQFDEGKEAILNHFHTKSLSLDCGLGELTDSGCDALKSIATKLSPTCTKLCIHCSDKRFYSPKFSSPELFSQNSPIHFAHFLLRQFTTTYSQSTALEEIEFSLPISETLAKTIGDTLCDSSKWPNLKRITIGPGFTTIHPRLLIGLTSKRNIVRCSSPEINSWFSFPTTSLKIEASYPTPVEWFLLGMHLNELKSLSLCHVQTIDELLVGCDLCGVRETEILELNVKNWNCERESVARFLQITKNVTSLNVENKSVDNLVDGLLCLQNLKTLVIQLSYPEGVTIAPIIPNLNELKSLSSLTLTNCKITDEILAQIAPAVSNMRGLKELNLGYNNIQSIGIEHLVKAQLTPSIESLNLEYNQIETLEGVAQLIELISFLSSLTYLHIGGNSFKDEGLVCLGEAATKFPKLKSFVILGNELSDHNSLNRILAEMKELTYLDISYNNFSPIVSILNVPNSLLKFRFAMNMFYNGEQIVGEEFTQLSTKIKYLTELDLSWSKFDGAVGEAFFFPLMECSSLTSLIMTEVFMESAILDKFVKRLDSFSNLQEFQLSGVFFNSEQSDIFCENLVELKQLTALEFSNITLSNNCAQFAKTIAKLVLLKRLVLSGNRMSEEAICSLSQSLCSLTSLISLKIQTNSLGDIGAEQISKCLKYLPQLQTLGLRSNLIGDHGTRCICEVLPHLTNLTSLDLSENKMSDQVVSQMVGYLSQLERLVSFRFGKRSFSEGPYCALTPFLDAALNDKSISANKKAICVMLATKDETGTNEWKEWNAMRSISLELGTFFVESLSEKETMFSNQFGEVGFPLALKRERTLSQLLNFVISRQAHQLATEMATLGFFPPCIPVGWEPTNVVESCATKYPRGLDILADVYITERLDLDFSGPVARDSLLKIWDRLAHSCNHITLNCDNSEENILSVGQIANMILDQGFAFKQLKSITFNGQLAEETSNRFAAILPDKQLALERLDFGPLFLPTQTLVANILAHSHHLMQFTFPQLKALLTGEDYQTQVVLTKQITCVEASLLGNCAHKMTDFDLSGAACTDLVFQAWLLGVNANEKDLQFRSIGIKGMARNVKDFVARCLQVESVTICENNFSKSECEQLAGTLACLPKLTQLDLSRNALGKIGAQLIGNSLGSLSSLTVLNLAGNHFGPDGIASIIGPLSLLTTLTKLDLSDNILREDGAKQLANALQKLTLLTHLNLSGNILRSEGANLLKEPLAALKELCSLNLSANDFEDLGAPHLAEFLGGLTNLTSLNISENSFCEDDSLCLSVALSKLTNLEQLDLSGNRFSPNCAKEIIRSLHQATQLTRLNISGNQLRDDGAKHLAELLGHVTNIKSLNISANDISFSGINELTTALAKTALTTLDISQNFALKPHDLSVAISALLEVLPNLTELNLSADNFKTAERFNSVLTKITKMPALQSLKMSDMVTERNWNPTSLLDCSALTELDVSANRISATTFANIPETAFTSLLTLNVSEIDLSSCTWSGLHTLTSIDASNCKLSQAGGVRFAEFLIGKKNLRSLNLSANNLANEGMGALAQPLLNNLSLTQLDLSGNQIDRIAALQLVKPLNILKALQVLDLSENDIGTGLQALSGSLAGLTSLKDLRFSGNNVGTENAEAFAFVLSKLPALTSLSIAKNNLGQADLSVLGKPLSQLKGLTKLDIAVNKLGEQGSKVLDSIVQQLPGIQYLDISNNKFGPSLQNLDTAFSQFMALKSLKITNNKLGQGNKPITALTRLNALTELDISTNQFRSSSWASMAPVVATLTTLTKLNISQNGLDANCAQPLANMLQNLTRLAWLDLQQNPLGDNGTALVCNGLCPLKRLTYLCLRKIGMEETGGQSFLTALPSLKKLEELRLSENVLPSHIIKHIALQLLEKPNMRKLTVAYRLAEVDADVKDLLLDNDKFEVTN